MITTKQMLATGVNLAGRPLTERQRRAINKRGGKIGWMKSAAKECIGCYSGIVPADQGSDYCARCIRRDR